MIKAIISDSDGTLVNTLYLIRHGQYELAVTHLQEQGIPAHKLPSYEVYEKALNKAVGGPPSDTLEKTLRILFDKTEQEGYIKNIDFGILALRLDSIQDRIAPLYIHPFYGLSEMFFWVGKNQIALGIFTSGTSHQIVRNIGVSLPALGYTELFRLDNVFVHDRLQALVTRTKIIYGIAHMYVVTCEDMTRIKPDPEGILTLMDKLHVAPEEVIVLGDHPVDIIAAKRAGVHAIGISHGFGTPAELTEAGAVCIVDDLLPIPKLIEAHNRGESKLF